MNNSIEVCVVNINSNNFKWVGLEGLKAFANNFDYVVSESINSPIPLPSNMNANEAIEMLEALLAADVDELNMAIIYARQVKLEQVSNSMAEFIEQANSNFESSHKDRDMFVLERVGNDLGESVLDKVEGFLCLSHLWDSRYSYQFVEVRHENELYYFHA